jgi:hypothetical protein
MAFWKRPIELPRAFYQAAGECVLDYVLGNTTVPAGWDWGDPSMTFNQGYEL